METYSNYRSDQTTTERAQYWDVVCNYFLFVASCILLVFAFLSFGQPHRSQNILADLQNWHSNQIFKQTDDRLKGLLQQIDGSLLQLTNLQKDEEKLLLRVKKNYLQANEDQDDIEEIQIFQGKLTKIKAVIQRRQPQTKALRGQYEDDFLKLKKQYEGREREGLVFFKQQGTDIIKEAEQTRVALGQFLARHGRWFKTALANQLKREESELNAMSEVQFFSSTYSELDSFKSMPALARKVLNPSPLQFLSYLYAKQPNMKQFLSQRQQFYQGRLQMSKLKSFAPALSLIRYNMLSSTQVNEWSHQIFEENKRLQSAYKLSQFDEQKGICVVVPSFNNNQLFRVELNLNSIFAQNYSNYKVLIIDDASIDGTQDLIERYLNYYAIPESKAQLIKNTVSQKALQNIYEGILSSCTDQEIVVIVDGDDQLIGFNVLRVINAAYSREKIGFLYSNFLYYHQSKKQVELGFTSEYTQGEKQQNYRRVNQKFSHLITFQVELLRQVRDADLKDEGGRFYDVAYDFALFFPLMELACGRVRRLDEYQYLYNIGTGLNDYDLNKEHQRTTGTMILSKAPYGCAAGYEK